MIKRNIKKNSSALSKKNKFDAVLSAVAQSVHKSLELHEVLDSAVETINKNMDHVDNISIYMVEGDIAVLTAHRGYSDTFIQKVTNIPYPKGFTWKTIIDGKSTYVSDVDTDTVIGPAGRELGTKSYFSTPIHFESKTVGAININSFKKNAFDKNDLNLLEIVARQIEVAFTNSKKMEILRQSEQILSTRNREIEEAYKMLEQRTMQMIQVEKMVSIGTMVGGIVHELNNPFMSIINYLEYCLKYTPNDDKRYVFLKHANDEVNRCINIVNKLTTFSRIEQEGPETLEEESCTEIFERVLELLDYRIKKLGASVTLHTAIDTPKILLQVSSIQQVFLNILNNALDAVEDRDRKEIHIDVRSQWENINIIVSDSGKGIPFENLSRIFDPFFTTKPFSKGTGLGLSLCRSIVMQHKGEVKCESILDEGTKFIISLPILNDNNRSLLNG